MSAKVVGINSELLKKLILDIYEYRDRISKILEDVEILVEGTKIYYKAEDGDEFRSKFKTFMATMPNFLSNIKSYGTDLEKVLKIYKGVDIKSVDIFKK